ncbi:hypothetical protein QZM89_07415 [Burkholderia gladioli]|uniref:hypothetical protein n=1 Tax=Burkholderia gladioli TaxID=28095 RepID=UPI002650A392|nr:hypothetical protein [Burkholderia gladioli]MDN7495010.1 hypothetical protein [Burkholderia gladioli]
MFIRNLLRRHRLLEGETNAASGAPAGDGQSAAPAGQAPAAAAAGGAAPAAGTDTGDSPSDWLQGIDDAELRTFVEGKGFKSAGEAIAALREVEGKYSAPDKPEGYELGDGDFAKTAATWFHESGVPAATAKALAGKWNTYVQDQTAAAEAARVAAGEQQITALRTEWGDSYDKNVELGRQAMRKFGVSGEVIDKLAGASGDAAVIKTFSQIGAAISEGTLNPGGAGGSGGAAPTNEDARAAKLFDKS